MVACFLPLIWLDVSQHEVPLPPSARSGCYAAQHGLLDGADNALRKVGVAPGHLLLDVPEIHQLLELPLELGAVVGVHVGRRPQGLEHLLHARGGARKTVLQPPNLAYSDPEMALRNIGRRAKQGLLEGQQDSLERKGIQGSLRRERGDGWPEKVVRDLPATH